VNGICFIGHGSSSAYAAFNGIRASAEALSQKINHLIVEEIKRLDTNPS
jgi:fatty acid/phospholipid biosynthesis enzyme